MRIAIIGASGFGKYHAREFKNAGAEVVALVGSSKDSSAKTAESLKKDFGISAKPYWNIKDMLKIEKIDMVSICTPPNLHFPVARECLSAGVNVFCEKPLAPSKNNLELAKKLFSLAGRKGKIFALDTQWPSILSYVDIPKKISTFLMSMQPGVKGKDMLYDHLSHTNSVLVKLIPEGKVSNIKISKETDEHIKIEFNYSNKKNSCQVIYIFDFKAERPREVKFSINGKEYKREFGENNTQFLVSNNKKIKIEDPLRTSIKKFIGSISREEPLNTEQNFLENLGLQDKIISAYES
jgi:hypothetical protein